MKICCVFGRSHNDFVVSVSIKETAAESFDAIRNFSEGIDEILN